MIARRCALVLLLMSPSWGSTAYLLLVAHPQYASEASFVIRAASRPSIGGGGLGALLTTFGLAQSRDDVFAVQDYMMSRDAVRELDATLNLSLMFGRPAFDPFMSFPSIVNGRSMEHLHSFYRRMVEVVHNSHTGLTTTKVRAFSPADAQNVSNQLLLLGERMVNRINQRRLEDAVQVAGRQVALAEQRVLDAQHAISTFRNREMTLDPNRASVLVIEIIGRLNAELAATRAQIAEVQAQSPNSPNAVNLARRADALVQQINEERQRATGRSEGVVTQLAEFDRLSLERDFAGRALTAALASMQVAQADARRQQLFLERVTEPSRPDHARYPQTTRWVITNLTLNIIAVLIGWLLYVGAREHKRGLEIKRRS